MKPQKSWVKFILQPTVSRPVYLDIGLPLEPMTRFYPYLFFSEHCFVVIPVGRPLWREDGSVTYSSIADLSGHWGPITIHYRLIWDCVPSSSLLTTRRDCGGGILTRLDTGCYRRSRSRSHITTDGQSASSSWYPASFGASDQMLHLFEWQVLSLFFMWGSPSNERMGL
jgi:hypothetical protein